MARKGRKPKGYKKALDMLDCGIQLIAESGKRGTRSHQEAIAIKQGDTYLLQVGISNSFRSKDADEFMIELANFTDYGKWMGIEPEDRFKISTSKRKVEVLTLNLDEHKSKKGR